MGIMETISNNQNRNTSARGTRQSTAANDKPKAQTWINVGYEVNGRFINLPLGIPLDTMEQQAVRGQDPDYAAVQHAQNALLAELQKIGDSLEAGAAETVNLTVQIRRVNDVLEVKPEDNAFSLANAGLNLRSA